MALPTFSKPDPILSLYQTLVEITQTMLEAARRQDWDDVLSHGQRYCDEVERLRSLAPDSPPDETSRTHKHDLLVRILTNDAEVRELAMPQLARLGELLGRMRKQQSLLSVYGPSSRT